MENLWPEPAELGLLTDLYELTMAQAYRAEGMEGEATFSLFFRGLPGERNYILACGQEYAAHLVTGLRFPREQVERLKKLELFGDDFLDWLANYRFSGDIHTMPEGTPVFPHEPMLEVTAPVAEAQLLESLLMNYVNVETLLASKASRMVQAADGKPVVDFGMRRMQGMEAALRGVRAYRVAGITGTSNVLGSLQYGLPARGTMAHSFVQAYENELDAFRAYARLYPGTTLVVDTYDTLEAVDKVIRLVRDEGLKVGAVRLDSGDLRELARATRRRLDAAGLDDILIIASGGLDEWEIRDLSHDSAPIDGFGVGTEMGAVADAPALDFAYKLTDYDGHPRLKNSPGKQLYPGRKQVWRFVGDDGSCTYDEITHRDEGRDGMPLLRPIVRAGATIQPPPDLEESAHRVRQSLESLPPPLLEVDLAPHPYPVHFSEGLDEMRAEVLARLVAD